MKTKDVFRIETEEELFTLLRSEISEGIKEEAKRKGVPIINPFNSSESLQDVHSYLLLNAPVVVSDLPVQGELKEQLDAIEDQELLYHPSVCDLLTFKNYRIMASEIYNILHKKYRSELAKYFFDQFQKEGKMLLQRDAKIFLRLSDIYSREDYSEWYELNKPVFLPEDINEYREIFRDYI